MAGKRTGVEREAVVYGGYTYLRYQKSKHGTARRYFKRVFRNRSVYLHRVIWEEANGPIPAGFDVHHVDGNTTNNEISNLALMGRSEHLGLHGRSPEHAEVRRGPRKPEHAEKLREILKRARPEAAKWHSSPEGLAWHAKHAAECIRREFPRKCAECGADFIGKISRAAYCTSACHKKRNARFARDMRKRGHPSY
jgi:hypothetical protein